MTFRILLLLAALCINPLCNASQQPDLCERYRLTEKECTFVFESSKNVDLKSGEEIQLYREEMAKYLASQRGVANTDAEIDRFLDGDSKGGNKRGKGYSALVVAGSAIVSFFVLRILFKLFGGSVDGISPSATGKRWRNWVFVIALAQPLISTCTMIFNNSGGWGAKLLMGFIGAVALAVFAYSLGYIVAKFRGGDELSEEDVLAAKPIFHPAPSNTAPEAIPVSKPAVTPPVRTESEIYKLIANELESGNTDKATWTKAFALADGDDKQTRAKYIKLRFAALSS